MSPGPAPGATRGGRKRRGERGLAPLPGRAAGSASAASPGPARRGASGPPPARGNDVTGQRGFLGGASGGRSGRRFWHPWELWQGRRQRRLTMTREYRQPLRRGSHRRWAAGLEEKRGARPGQPGGLSGGGGRPPCGAAPFRSVPRRAAVEAGRLCLGVPAGEIPRRVVGGWS